MMWDVPYPNPERPRIMMQLSHTSEMLLSLPVESPIPIRYVCLPRSVSHTMVSTICNYNCVYTPQYYFLCERLGVYFPVNRDFLLELGRKLGYDARSVIGRS